MSTTEILNLLAVCDLAIQRLRRYEPDVSITVNTNGIAVVRDSLGRFA